MFPLSSSPDADVADHPALEGTIERMFENPNVLFMHLHNAKLGCFMAGVTKALSAAPTGP